MELKVVEEKERKHKRISELDEAGKVRRRAHEKRQDLARRLRKQGLMYGPPSPKRNKWIHKDRYVGKYATSREYAIYKSMLERCTLETNANYYRYGGRGITVCESWRNNFTNFLNDMGPRPSDLHGLDRIDNDGDYAPENCRWTDIKTQNRNRPQTKLTVEKVREIKELLRKKTPHTQIAAMYGVVRETISRIAQGRNWTEVT